MKWRGKSYRPAFGVPVYPKKQNDIRELMKPLSEKTHKGNVWIPVVMNVPKDETTPVPSTPTPTPTLTATPTPTPTASALPPASPCEQIDLTAVPSGQEAYIGTYTLVNTTPDRTEANEAGGFWLQDPSYTHVLYVGDSNQGVLAYENTNMQWTMYPFQTFGNGDSLTDSPQFGFSFSDLTVGGLNYPGSAAPNVTYTYVGGCP